MFGPKKPSAASQKKPNGPDVLLQKLAALPPAMDLLIAAIVGGYSLVAIFVDNAKVVGIACILIASIFAMLGINAVMREMKAYKRIETYLTHDDLRSMKTKQFEQYLAALFFLDGFRVRSAIDELDRFDDADLIAEKKGHVILIQYNHFDEDFIDLKPIQSLWKAASISRATGCIAITVGRFTPAAVTWANRKEVTLMNIDDIIAMACRLTGKVQADAHPTPPQEILQEQQHEVSEVLHGHHRLIFVDFAGLDHGLVRLNELLMDHLAYQIVATTLPPLNTMEDIRAGLGECGDRLIGYIEASQDGRYYAIQNYLQSSPEGKQTIWLAVDSEPRQYPEGCTGVIAVNRAFGFDSSAAQRLLDAMLLADRRPAQLQENESPKLVLGSLRSGFISRPET